LYSISAFLVLDTDGNRVLAKYYSRPKDAGVPESKFSNVKDQKAFEKGLWEKTKKPGGLLCFALEFRRCVLISMEHTLCRGCDIVRLTSGTIQALPRPDPLPHWARHGERADARRSVECVFGCIIYAAEEPGREEECVRKSGRGSPLPG
jgi:hypothetical protein